MAELRPNRVKHKLQDGGVATIVQGEITPSMAEFFGPLGFDGVWLEAEHGPFDYGDIPDFTRACDLWGLTSVARVNLNLPGVIYRTLDQGVQAVVVPHVDTADDAHAVVDAAKFHPIGHRGNYTSRQGIGVEDYINKANDETMVIVLIEDIVAINALDEILRVDHVDVFFVAPGDLAQSMGYPGGANHPEVSKTVDDAIKQIVGADRVAGTLATSSNVADYIDLGARFLSTNWPLWMTAGAKEYLREVSEASR